MGKRYLLAVAAIIAVAAVAAAAILLSGRGRGYPVRVEVSTPAIGVDGFFSQRYTCDGEDLSPELRVRLSGDVGRIRSLVVVMVDPDAPGGTFIHWVLYDVPVSSPTIVIPEGLPRKPMVEGVGLQGRNSFGWIGYGGPCPPRGSKPHHYIIRVYALDTVSLGLPPGASYGEVMKALKGHVLGVGEVVGLYKRA